MKTPSSPSSKRPTRESLMRAVERASREEAADQGAGIVTEPRVVAELSASALVNNFRVIADLAPEHSVLPMIKANAYGHGAVWAARQLLQEPKLEGLGVSTLPEGKELRKELGAKARNVRIVVFSGALGYSQGFSDEVGQYCEKYELTPVISSDDSWNAFRRGGWAERIPYELEFNTGMNRLGISASLAGRIATELAKLDAGAHPQGVMTHFAAAEAPESKLTQTQIERFIAIRKEFTSRCPSTRFHLANSAAIWNRKNYGLDGISDLVRPGISLYGVPPWAGAPLRGLSPVMTLRSRVLARYDLKAGESVGYGGTFVAGQSAPPAQSSADVGGDARGAKHRESVVRVATVAAGYADGLLRSLKGTGGNTGGFAWVQGRPERFVGIVSMDLSAVTCSSATKPGDWVEWMGPNVDAWAQARAAGTVPYELLTSVSARVQRNYV